MGSIVCKKEKSENDIILCCKDITVEFITCNYIFVIIFYIFSNSKTNRCLNPKTGVIYRHTSVPPKQCENGTFTVNIELLLSRLFFFVTKFL